MIILSKHGEQVKTSPSLKKAIFEPSIKLMSPRDNRIIRTETEVPQVVSGTSRAKDQHAFLPERPQSLPQVVVIGAIPLRLYRELADWDTSAWVGPTRRGQAPAYCPRWRAWSRLQWAAPSPSSPSRGLLGLCTWAGVRFKAEYQARRIPREKQSLIFPYRVTTPSPMKWGILIIHSTTTSLAKATSIINLRFQSREPCLMNRRQEEIYPVLWYHGPKYDIHCTKMGPFYAGHFFIIETLILFCVEISTQIGLYRMRKKKRT